MGNDLAGDQNFMAKYHRQVQDFVKQTPLFDAQEIEFPLSTKGVKIVDAKGRRVKLAGGNWSGGHLCRQCVDGLECRPLSQIADDIKNKFRMNCVRLTYSLQLYFDNSVIKTKYLKANPELIGKTAMEIFDFTVKTLTEAGLMVILNNHTSTSQWCCSNNDGDGLWWSYKYPEYMFFECAEEFARRYKDNPRVIGTDLRNQLRKANGLEATWGDNNPLTDWRRAASICAQKVLKIAPHWLIIVAGLNYQLDLTPIINHQLKLSVPNKLVYSGHLYSFSWPPSWASFSYDAFKKKMFNSQFFIRGLGFPILLGEFGNNKRDTLWNYLIKYLAETDVDWTYWPIDGFKCEPNEPDKDETYGIFTNDFRKIRNPDIFTDLQSIGVPKAKLNKMKKLSLKQQITQKKNLKENLQMEKKPIIENKNTNKVEQVTNEAEEKINKNAENKTSLTEEKSIQKANQAVFIPYQEQKQVQLINQNQLQEVIVAQNLNKNQSAQQSVPKKIEHYHSEEISIQEIVQKVHNPHKSQIKLAQKGPKYQAEEKHQEIPQRKNKLKIFQQKRER